MSRLQHKRGRKSNYARSLNNPYWEKVARNVRLRDGHKCRICGARYPLEVHHKRYKVMVFQLLERNLSTLIALSLCALPVTKKFIKEY